ncbi:nfx1-type zinc finger-containing protein 1 [Moniliophthora roreri MCA 2997]|uniref:Nfx1-type zinc finger-containing protein 1 n=1 Tax=Moniliophthora roreri (strain MCA 2997) TaxID=1381753 RepID=V2XHS8_MONRO|nr:nfx1-type zinc finger-containing protein 1 [Moniliophthora roreri MCA 2997]
MPSHELFDDVCDGKTKLNHRNVFPFLESLCSHPNPVPILLESPSGLSAFKRAMMTDFGSSFYNGLCCRVLSKLSQSKDLEEDVRRVLAALADPPLFYVSLFTSITEDYLAEETQKWFGWLLLQHVLQPDSTSSPWSSLLKVYKDTPAVEALLRSPRKDIREIGEKIIALVPGRTGEQEDEEKAGPGGRHDNDFEDFRTIFNMPTPAEVMSKAKPYLLPSSAFEKEEDPAKRCAVYLETQYRLLREAMVVRELREEVQHLLKGEGKDEKEPVIPNVEFVGIETSVPSLSGYWGWKFKCPEDFDLTFGRTAYTPPIPKLPGWRSWDLVLLMEGDEILAFCDFARDEDALGQTPPVLVLKPYGDEAIISNALVRLRNGSPKRLLRTGEAYWDEMEPIKKIQTMRSLPFTEEMLLLSTTPLEPEHLPADVLRALEVNDKCNIGQLLQTDGGRRTVILNEDQANALTAALQERVCLIQGMPGTGKTLLAALLAAILFQHTPQTIMVCCSAEHVLDRVLQEIHRSIPSLHTVTLLDYDSPQTASTLNSLRIENQAVNSQAPTYMSEGMDAMTEALSGELKTAFDKLMETSQDRDHILRYLASNHPTYHAAFSAPNGEDGSTSLFDRWTDGQDAPEAGTAQAVPAIWSLPVSERETLLKQWRTLILEEATSRFANVGEQLDSTRNLIRLSERPGLADVLRSKRLIGCTYNGLQTRLYALREAGKFPDVLIFADADRVSMDFTLAALGPETKHLIMIGSIPTRRPTVGDRNLRAGSKEGYEVDVSLFERLLKNGYPYHTLYTQHSAGRDPVAIGLAQNIASPVTPGRPLPANNYGGWGTWGAPTPPVALPGTRAVRDVFGGDSRSSRSPTSTRPPSPSKLPPILLSRKAGAAETEWNRRKADLGASNIHVDAIMEMTGIEEVKQQILDIMDVLETMKQQQCSMEGFTLNAALFGNSGTEMSVFAGHYTRFLKSMNMLAADKYHEVAPAQADDFRRQALEIQHGGAIHVTDADMPGMYGVMSWLNNRNTVGSVTASSLAEMMRAGAGKQAFIFSGPEPTFWAFLNDNPALRDALPQKFFFADYTREDLTTIMEKRLQETEMVVEGGVEGEYVQLALKRLISRHSAGSFENARTLEAFLRDVISRQRQRLAKKQKSDGNVDYRLITKEDLLDLSGSAGLEDALKELDSLIGLRAVKQTVHNLVKLARVNEQREMQGKRPVEIMLNRVFLGPSGTGKTTVVKAYAKILKQLGYLSNGEVIMKHANDFIGQVIGQSEALTKDIVAKAAGKVLIIDEAHILNPEESVGCFKQAVIDTLVSCVQNTPGGDQCIVLIGYEDEMLDMLQNANPGLARRFRVGDAFHFESFTQEELMQIFEAKLSEDQLSATPAAKAVVTEILERARHRPTFGNAGEVENLIASAKERFYERFDQSCLPDDVVFEPQDFDPDYGRSSKASERLTNLFADMVGCQDIMAKLNDYQKISHTMRICGKDARKVIPMNFVFKGPPGTGKTSVARKMGHVFYDMGFLSSPEVIECSASDMVGKYIGHTGPKTRELFTKALGKVLFIDEAYRLGHGSFSEEAIGELVTLLTLKTYQGKMVVILAGYDQDMDLLLSCNRGLSSRFPEEIVFKKTDADSCLEILKQELTKHGVTLLCLSDKRSKGYRNLAYVIKRMSGTRSWGNARDMVSLSVHLVREAHKQPPDPHSKTFEVSQKVALKYLMTMREEQRNRAATWNAAQGGWLTMLQQMSIQTLFTVLYTLVNLYTTGLLSRGGILW